VIKITNRYKMQNIGIENKQKYNMPDHAYVINLDIATKRWNSVSERLNQLNIKYSRFSATNGLLIKITETQTKEEFFGIDIKNKTNTIKEDITYNINCDPENQNSLNFAFKGYLNYIGNTISAGELGIWCSGLRALQDAKNNNYQQIIIFEDDVAPYPNMQADLSTFLKYLPQTYDLAYIGVTLLGKNNTIKINDFVNGFTRDAYGYGAYAVIFSNKAINKILSVKEYTLAIDRWFWCYSTGKINYQNNYFPNSKCNEYVDSLETYYSSVKMLDVLKICDEYSITKMGRIGGLCYDIFSSPN
jgi:glycosyl transferase family 25